MIAPQHRQISPDLAVLFSGNFHYTPSARPGHSAYVASSIRSSVGCGSALAIPIVSLLLKRTL
jgi:hypothetical protein